MEKQNGEFGSYDFTESDYREEKRKPKKKKYKRPSLMQVGYLLMLTLCMVVVIMATKTGHEKEVIYNEAIALEKEEEYQEALERFKTIEGSYDVSEHIAYIEDAISAKETFEDGVEYYNNKDYKNAIIKFANLKGTVYDTASTDDFINSCLDLINTDLIAIPVPDNAGVINMSNLQNGILGCTLDDGTWIYTTYEVSKDSPYLDFGNDDTLYYDPAILVYDTSEEYIDSIKLIFSSDNRSGDYKFDMYKYLQTLNESERKDSYELMVVLYTVGTDTATQDHAYSSMYTFTHITVNVDWSE